MPVRTLDMLFRIRVHDQGPCIPTKKFASSQTTMFMYLTTRQNHQKTGLLELSPPWVITIPKLKLGIFICLFHPPPLWEFSPYLQLTTSPSLAIN